MSNLITRFLQRRRTMRDFRDGQIIATGTVQKRWALAMKRHSDKTIEQCIELGYFTKAESIRYMKCSPIWNVWLQHCYINNLDPFQI